MPKILCVAEKPSIAKSISQILSGGQFTTRRGPSKFNMNYDFTYPQLRSNLTVTSVSGHLTSSDFGAAHRQWNSCDPFSLFDAPIIVSTSIDAKDIGRNLANEARDAHMLMIWTDCDREGEHIGLEIANICLQFKRDIEVRRARFSAIIAAQIHRAAQNPVQLDMQQAEAVAARIEIDLRLGAAFTRMQSLNLQNRLPELDLSQSKVISYGPCQFPTLGFVVSRYNQVQSFQPEQFWFIHLALSKPMLESKGQEGKKQETNFIWRRGHIFDKNIVEGFLEDAKAARNARIRKVTKKSTKKWKPLPLTTVELQKAGSRLLRIGPKVTLDIAEKLYQQGFLSYPRTETDVYDPQFDFQTLIGKQTADGVWGAFATNLQRDGFQRPRNGKHDDKAHPPIHPTAHAANLVGDEKKVYEYITRRFLATCSKDAVGFETTVDVLCGEEEFYATGLMIMERNYLDVYPYDKWADKSIPDFVEGEEILPSKLEIREGCTTSPTYLTEADLVTLMDKNGIGTDATIAQHIQTIIDRGYVSERMNGQTKYLIPSALGIGLVEGYNDIGFERSLSKPYLRREMERRMVQVCEGQKTKTQILVETIEQYKDIYIRARTEFGKVLESVRRNITRGPVDHGLGLGNTRNGGDDPEDDGDDEGGGARRGDRTGRSRGQPRGPRGSARGSARGPTRGPSTRGGPSGRGRGKSFRKGSFDPGPGSGPDSSRPPPQSSSSTSWGVADTHAENVQPRSNFVQTSSVGSSSGTGAVVLCLCGTPARQEVITRETANKGRHYYTCSTCSFFEFADGPWMGSTTTATNASTSSRGTIPSKRTVRDASSTNNESTQSLRKCKCSEDAIRLITTKDGPNKGRFFWTCAQKTCNYFEWDDDSSNRNSTGECFKCHQPNHWSSDCPNNLGGVKRQKSDSNPNSNPNSCFNCGQEGHWTANCPNGNERSGRTASSNRTSSRKGSRGASSGRGRKRGSRGSYGD